MRRVLTSADTPAPAAPPPGESARSDRLLRSLAAFGGLFLLDLIATFATVPVPADGIGVRLVRLAVDAGQHLALAVVTFAIVALGRRFLPPRAWLAAVAVLGFGLSVLLLRHDLANASESLTLFGQAWLGLGLMLAAAGLVLPLVYWLSGLRVPWLRVAGLAAVVAAGGANAVMLPRNYPGLHLYLALLAAVAAIRLVPRWRGLRVRHEALAAGLCALVAAPGLLVRPSALALSDLLQSPGAVLAPFVANVQLAVAFGGSQRSEDPWYRDRSGLPPVPPTSPRLAPAEPIVLLLTVDAFRADLTRREHAAALPALQRLLAGAAVFTHARSPSPQTAASIAAIFAGRLHSQLRWAPSPHIKSPSKTFPHEDPRPRFPELLQKAGIRTAVSTGTPTLLNRYALARGFDEELEDIEHAEDHVDRLLEKLRNPPRGAWFWWTHFLDAHAPYTRGGREGSQFERYVREIDLVTRQIGRVLDAVEKQGLASRTYVIVSSDHGEAFGEHNTRHHATTLYDELLRVPLLVRGPGVVPRTLEVPVSGLDLGPTILDLMGRPVPSSFLGQSLVPLLAGREARLERPLAAESGRSMRAMLFPDGFKLIVDERNGTLELYDLGRDPGELHNLFDAPEHGGEQRLSQLRAYFDAHEYRAPGYEKPFRP